MRREHNMEQWLYDSSYTKHCIIHSLHYALKGLGVYVYAHMEVRRLEGVKKNLV